ncbi:MAG: protein kinase [Planctomycetia bacterium]|nr:protein kinase [Planctomycetia bacterium]
MNTESYSFLLPPAGPDEIGRLGEYRVLRLLGKGGMALVFQAEDIALCRPVALKVMKPDLDREMGPWDRFLREARLMAAIKHEHLVTIYQAGQQGDIYYFAMELLEGESLEDWIKQHPQPDARDVLRMARELASGLGFIHDNGLIHRDIKPANIWLEAPSGRLKILDLGLARFVKEDVNLTQTGAVLGTPAFMSPEQARGDPLDARSDLFSLGCVLYAVCTGAKPFRGETSMAQLMSLAADTPRPIRELNPRIPASLAKLIDELLAKEPAERPATAQVVLDRLRQVEERMSDPSELMPAPSSDVVSQGSSSSRHSGLLALVRERRLRSIWLFGLTALAALVAVILTAALASPWFRAAPTSGRTALPPTATAATPPAAGDKVFLTHLKPSERDKWPFMPKKEGKGPPPNIFDTISVGGKTSPQGIGMHPPPPEDGSVSVTYRLDRAYRFFNAEVSLNDTAPEAESPLRFRIYGDGKLLWESQPISRAAHGQPVRVPVEGVNLLKLEVACSGSPRGAHGVWVEPHLER